MKRKSPFVGFSKNREFFLHFNRGEKRKVYHFQSMGRIIIANIPGKGKPTSFHQLLGNIKSFLRFDFPKVLKQVTFIN